MMAESEMGQSSADAVDETVDRVRELVVQTHESYRGPLPPADELAKYEETLPGLARTIVDMAQKEQAFRHETTHYEQETERNFFRQAAAKTYIGQIGAILITMTTIGCSVWLINNGHSAGGIAGIVTALAALSTVFIVGKRSESNKESASDDSDSE